MPATPACVDWLLPVAALVFQLMAARPLACATGDPDLVERGSAHSNYYDVLGVTPTAEPVTISAAYRALIKKYHPDRNAGDAEAVRRTRLLNEAYEVLCDPAARDRYDALTVSGDARARGPDRPRRAPHVLTSASFIAKILGSAAALAVLGLLVSWLVRAPTQDEAITPVSKSPSMVAETPARRDSRPRKPPRMPPLTTAFLAGSWVPAGSSCASGDTYTFLPDGRWVDRNASGTWSARKNRLTFVTTRMLDANGRWAALASPVRRIEKVRVQTPDRITSVAEGGARRVLDRCPSSGAKAAKPRRASARTPHG